MTNLTLDTGFLDEVEKIEDQSVTDTGGNFEYVPPAAGTTMARLVEYVELGKQPQKPYQGKPKPPAEEVRLVFECLSPAWLHDVQDEKGNVSKRADRIVLTLKKSFNEKAKYKKVFTAMVYGRPYKHLARCLNEVFLLDIKHNAVGEGADRKVYANIIDSTGIHIKAPVIANPLDGTQINVAPKCPAALSPLRLFIWDMPKIEHWHSLFIDGDYTVKDGDKEITKSKNTIQQKILGAADYQGSPLQIMLGKLNNLPDTKTPQATETAQGQASGNQAISGAAKAETPSSPTAAPASAADDLAALGLEL